MITVFLGGTCNKSTWREELIAKLDSSKVKVFNPVVDNWDEKAQQNELLHRKCDDFCLYVLTPEMTGFYSVAEDVDDSNKRPEKTIFCVLEERNGKKFTDCEIKGFEMMKQMVSNNGAVVMQSLDQVASYLNNYPTKKLQNQKNKYKQDNITYNE